MSELYQCLSCGGVYQPIQPDGMLYFHACPPLTTADPTRIMERPDKRDENLAPGGTPELACIKAEGRGRTPYVEAPPAEAAPARTLLARVRDFVLRRQPSEEA